MRLARVGLILATAALAACDDGRDRGGGPTASSTDARPRDASASSDIGADEDAAKLIPDASGARLDAGAARSDAAVYLDAAPDLDAGAPDALAPPDSGTPPGPTPDECLEGWRQLPPGACAAPVIERSYVSEGCLGTTGWFVEGANFQHRQHNVGVADYGPQSIGANSNQQHWNVIRPELLCVTVAASSRNAWVGHEIYVINPDGQRSNAVVVQDYWPGPPPPRATDAGIGAAPRRVRQPPLGVHPRVAPDEELIARNVRTTIAPACPRASLITRSRPTSLISWPGAVASVSRTWTRS